MNLKTGYFSSLLILALAGSGTAYANPNGAQVIKGKVHIAHPDPNTLNITNSPGAIVNWQQFSIQTNQVTRFIQQNAASAILNRVVGQNPSALLGQLLSNGRVFLINPNGIVFGPNSVIDTAGLIASTLDMTDEDFINQNLKFQGSNAADIQNQGYIKAGKNGDIFLIAPNIENSGIIETDGGQLILAAGESVTIASLDSDHIIFDVQAPENEVVNLGEMITNGGAARMFAGTIKHSGSINANSIAVDKNGNVQIFAKTDIEISKDAAITANGSEGGEVKIESNTGTVWNSGTIEAIGTEQQGGHVEVLGERVALLDEASIDVSGETGGGEVLIGGDYQGKNEDVKNAKQTFVGEDTSIKADAVTNGDGGKVIVWADETAQVYGNISAHGGEESGDGGFVETSGKKHLDVTNAPDISAANGSGGTWLLDPENVTISTGGDSNITGSTPFQPAAAGSSVLNTTTLQTALNAGGTIIVDTTGGGSGTGDLTVSNVVTKTSGADATLDLRAHNDLNINASITSSNNLLNMIFNADQDSVGGGVINLGNVTLDANGGTIDATNETVNIASGATINSAFTVDTLNFSSTSGNLNIGDTLSVTSAMNWTGSGFTPTISGGGGGILDIPLGSVFNITAYRIGSTQFSVLDNLVVNNAGTINLNPGGR